MSYNSILFTCLLCLLFGVIYVESWTINQHSRPFCSPFRTFSSSIHAKRPQDSSKTTTTNNSDPFQGISNLLDDGSGHIRSELATSIWNWEHEHRTKDHLPKFTYSTRAGLRLVDEIAKELLALSSSSSSSSSSSGGSTIKANDRTVTTYSDLIQEGVVALMYCMSKYNADLQNESFEVYAKRHILSSLQKVLAHDFRPIQLPAHVLKLLKQAKVKRQALETKTGREPTLATIAQELNISPQQLELYTMLGSKSLSVERTMEILDPLTENKATFADEFTWQQQHGDTSSSDDIRQEEAQEGEDEMFWNVEAVAAPLVEMVVDDEAHDNPNEMLAETMIHDDVHLFLSKTLDTRELTIVEQRFGLTSGQVVSLEEIGAELGISASRVAQIEREAMSKLRNSYTNAQVETYLEEAVAVQKGQDEKDG